MTPQLPERLLIGALPLSLSLSFLLWSPPPAYTLLGEQLSDPGGKPDEVVPSLKDRA